VFVEHSELLASITQSLPSDLKTEYSDLPSHLKSKYAPTWNRISQLLTGLKPEYSEFSTDSILEYSDLPTDLKAKYALPHQSETRVLDLPADLILEYTELPTDHLPEYCEKKTLT
jgi:hypothetical protein